MDDDRGRGAEWFAAGGGDYARFRPDYPAAVAAYVAQQAPGRALAVDVGCGPGEFTRELAAHFDAVLGIDASADQIAHAAAAPGVTYTVAGAEALPVPDGAAAAITAAQAAHWFDLPRFYAEVRRIAAPGAVLALITYGALKLDGDLQQRFDHFYNDEIGPYWPPERAYVQARYTNLDFPFPRLDAPEPVIERDWTLPQLLGYVSTWSAVRRAQADGEGARLTAFGAELAGLWGPADRRRPVRWPVTILAGRVGPTASQPVSRSVSAHPPLGWFR